MKGLDLLTAFDIEVQTISPFWKTNIVVVGNENIYIYIYIYNMYRANDEQKI